MKFLLVLMAALLLVNHPAMAKPCYTPSEYNAEKLLRLHSELMVITVTCRYGSQGQNLVTAYTGFTQNNLSAIKHAEKMLTNFYRENFDGDPVSRLDVLRTKLGNEMGQHVADSSAPAFCAARRDRVMALMGAAQSTVLTEAERLSVNARTYSPLCTNR